MQLAACAEWAYFVNEAFGFGSNERLRWLCYSFDAS